MAVGFSCAMAGCRPTAGTGISVVGLVLGAPASGSPKENPAVVELVELVELAAPTLGSVVSVNVRSPCHSAGEMFLQMSFRPASSST
jgi:hypothetical protein